MIEPYTAELEPPLNARLGARGLQAIRVQEWLALGGLGVAIDGDFGPATSRAVQDFQGRFRLPVTGVVDGATWARLAGDLIHATPAVAGLGFGAAAVAIAAAHLRRRAREVGADNSGPWVRHYCRGQSVAWCQGFASTIWADAARALSIEPPLALELDGIWCLFVPRMVQEARRAKRYVDGREGVRPTPGSMFFLRGGAYGYSHVGLVEAAHDDGTMSTIEGNTNDDGSANGYEVARRIRRVISSDFAVLP